MYRHKRNNTRINDIYINTDNKRSCHKCSKSHKIVSELENTEPYKNKKHILIDITEEEIIINNSKCYNVIANVIDIYDK